MRHLATLILAILLIAPRLHAAGPTPLVYDLVSSNGTILFYTNINGLKLDLTAVVPASTNSGNWQAIGTNSANLAPSGGTATMPFAAIGTNYVGYLVTTNGPQLNVRAWGAVGDGSTDDTTAFANAQAAAAVRGSVVYIPGSTNAYIVNKLQLREGVTWLGDGAFQATNATILQSTGTNAVFVLGNDSGAFEQGFKVSGIRFTGSSTATWLFKVQGGAHNVIVDNCAFVGGVGQVLVQAGATSGAYTIDFVNDLFYNGANSADMVKCSYGATFLTDVHFRSCFFEGASFPPSGHVLVVDGCIIDANCSYMDAKELKGILMENTVSGLAPAITGDSFIVDGETGKVVIEATDAGGSQFIGDYMPGNNTIDGWFKATSGTVYTNIFGRILHLPQYSSIPNPVVQVGMYFQPDGQNDANNASSAILSTSGNLTYRNYLPSGGHRFTDSRNVQMFQVFDSGTVEATPNTNDAFVVNSYGGGASLIHIHDGTANRTAVLRLQTGGNFNIDAAASHSLQLRTSTGTHTGLELYDSGCLGLGGGADSGNAGDVTLGAPLNNWQATNFYAWNAYNIIPSGYGSVSTTNKITVDANQDMVIDSGGYFRLRSSGNTLALISPLSDDDFYPNTNQSLKVHSVGGGIAEIKLVDDASGREGVLRLQTGGNFNINAASGKDLQLANSAGVPRLTILDAGGVGVESGKVTNDWSVATLSQGSTKILTAGQHLTNIADIASSAAVAQVLSGTNTAHVGGVTGDNAKFTNNVDAATYSIGGAALLSTGSGNVNVTGHLVEGTVDIATLTSGSQVNTNAITTGSLAAVTNVTSAALVGTNAINGGIITAATNFVGEAGGLSEALAPTNSAQLATKAYVDAAIPSTFTYYFYGSSNNTTLSGLVQPLRSTNWAYASPAQLTANTNTIASATNATYIAAYVTADTFRQLSSGNVNMDIYASFNTGAGRAAAIHPEIYLYDTVGNSNIIEFPNAPPDQTLSGTLALYTFSVAITNFTWTNPFRVICKVKATTTNLPDISLVTESNFTSHIDFNVPGGTFVQKAGDTMTGTLNGTTITASTTVTSPEIVATNGITLAGTRRTTWPFEWIITNYTTVNLYSTAPTNVPAYCTDCLKPDGIGSLAISDGQYWRTPDGKLVTNTNLDYCRTWLVHGTGQKFFNTYDALYDGPSDANSGNAFPNVGSTGTGASLGFSNLAASTTNQINMAVQLGWGTTAAGAQMFSMLTRGASFKPQSVDFAYVRVEYYLAQQIDDTHKGWFQIGFGDQGTSASTTPPTGFVGYLIDATNVWGFNGTTLNLGQFMVKSGATSTNWTFDSQAPPTTYSARQAIEILMEPGQVTFLTNGVQHSQVAIGNYYPTNTVLWPLLYVVSTTGSTTANLLTVPKFNAHVRLKAPELIPISGTIYP